MCQSHILWPKWNLNNGNDITHVAVYHIFRHNFSYTCTSSYDATKRTKKCWHNFNIMHIECCHQNQMPLLHLCNIITIVVHHSLQNPTPKFSSLLAQIFQPISSETKIFQFINLFNLACFLIITMTINHFISGDWSLILVQPRVRVYVFLYLSTLISLIWSLIFGYKSLVKSHNTIIIVVV